VVAADWTNHRDKHGPPHVDREVDSLLLRFATEKKIFGPAAALLETSKPEMLTEREREGIGRLYSDRHYIYYYYYYHRHHHPHSLLRSSSAGSQNSTGLTGQALLIHCSVKTSDSWTGSIWLRIGASGGLL